VVSPSLFAVGWSHCLEIVRGVGYLRSRHESCLLHRKIGCEVLMELSGIPDVCN
jgi:hypothetical protein